MVIIVAVCAVMVISVAAYLVDLRARLLDRTRIEAAALAETIDQHAERSIQEVDLSIRGISDVLKSGADAGRLHLAAADYARWLPQVARFIVLDGLGQPTTESFEDTPAVPNQVIRDAFEFSSRQSSGALAIGLPALDPAIDGWTITLSRSVRNAERHLLGVVVALVDLDHFATFYRSLGFQGPTTILSLLDGQTRLLVRYPERSDMVGTPLPGMEVLDASIEPGRQLRIEALPMLDGGIRRAYVDQVGRLPVFTLVAVDEDALLGPWWKEVATFAMVLAVLVATIAWLGRLGVRQMAQTHASERTASQNASWLRATIESIDQGVTVFDSAGHLVTSNRNAERLLGFPAGGLLIGRHFGALVRDSARRGEYEGADVEVMIPKLLQAADRPGGDVYERTLSNGTTIEVRRTPMAGGGFVTSYRDVTDQRLASRRLEQRAEILKILHSVSQAANEAPDLASAMREILHLIADGAGWPVAVAHQLVPDAEATVTPAHWYLADPDRFEPFKIACSDLRIRAGEGLEGRVLETGASAIVPDLSSEPPAGHKDAAAAAGLKTAFAVPVLERRRVVGVLVFFSDQVQAEDYFLFAVLDTISAQISRVAERARSESSLKARELRLRAIFDSVDDGIITINETGSIETVNPSAERMFGVRAVDIASHDIRSLLEGGDRRFAGSDAIGCLVQATAQGPVSDLKATRSDGTSFPVELAARDMNLDDRRLAVVVMRDISERRRIDRLRDEFVSTVSHELRTPLTSVAGSLSLLDAGVAGELPAEAGKLIGIARDNSRRLVDLINSILDIEKMESGLMEFAPRSIDVVQLAREGIEAVGFYAEKYDITYRLIAPDIACPVFADPERIMQVLSNLLSNAAKFSPAGATVDVVIGEPVGQRMRIRVVDQGDGIPEAFRGQVFEKFSQADATDSRAKDGTGFGLSIVKAIIERSGGDVGFDSIEGQGTNFWFELPLAAPVESTAQTVRSVARH